MLIKLGTSWVDPQKIECISVDSISEEYGVSIHTSSCSYDEKYETLEQANEARDEYAGIVNNFYNLSQSFGSSGNE